MSVTLHIDQLVLRGIDPMDKHALADGLKTELARVLSDPATRAALGQSRRTPVMRLGRMAGARALGGSVAKAIGKGMRP
jgi:hypothetical protein